MPGTSPLGSAPSTLGWRWRQAGSTPTDIQVAQRIMDRSWRGRASRMCLRTITFHSPGTSSLFSRIQEVTRVAISKGLTAASLFRISTNPIIRTRQEEEFIPDQDTGTRNPTIQFTGRLHVPLLIHRPL